MDAKTIVRLWSYANSYLRAEYALDLHDLSAGMQVDGGYSGEYHILVLFLATIPARILPMTLFFSVALL